MMRTKSAVIAISCISPKYEPGTTQVIKNARKALRARDHVHEADYLFNQCYQGHQGTYKRFYCLFAYDHSTTPQQHALKHSIEGFRFIVHWGGTWAIKNPQVFSWGFRVAAT